MAVPNTQHNGATHSPTFSAIAGAACFAIGAVFAISAAVLWLAASLEPQQHFTGAWMLAVAAAGSFGLAAHSMDVADRAEQRRFEEDTDISPPPGNKR
ncbi:MAG: hypothetical protein QUS14_06250 [Pyrinomonadaceae bacterium]|nr:hypothetical protein [Pyrinomonadaceae bacterium]